MWRPTSAATACPESCSAAMTTSATVDERFADDYALVEQTDSGTLLRLAG